MLAANETVAGYLEHKGVPSLYRIHEKPDPKKVLEFERSPPPSAIRWAWARCRCGAWRCAPSAGRGMAPAVRRT